MKKLLAIGVILLSQQVFAQADSVLKPLKLISGRYDDFTADNLGNIFLLDKGNQLKKISATGDSIAVYNDVRRYGKLFSIDATNPLKILLFYKDFATIVVLDRLLNVRNTIDLRMRHIFQPAVICQSYDNGIWVYDEGDARLKRLADDGSIIDQTGDLRLQLEVAPAPQTIADQDRLVYLYDTARGLLAFDYFGTLKNKIAFRGWTDFQVIGKYLVGRKGDTLERYRLSTLLLQERFLPQILKGAIRVQVGIDRLYCLKNDSLYVYAL